MRFDRKFFKEAFKAGYKKAKQMLKESDGRQTTITVEKLKQILTREPKIYAEYKFEHTGWRDFFLKYDGGDFITIGAGRQTYKIRFKNITSIEIKEDEENGREYMFIYFAAHIYGYPSPDEGVIRIFRPYWLF